MTHEYPLGSRVIINATGRKVYGSDFILNPDCTGTVAIAIDEYGWTEVQWDDGGRNGYESGTLDIIEEVKP